jgi:predicted RNA-binding Zn ribbon-like protein
MAGFVPPPHKIGSTSVWSTEGVRDVLRKISSGEARAWTSKRAPREKARQRAKKRALKSPHSQAAATG